MNGKIVVAPAKVFSIMKRSGHMQSLGKE